MTIFATTDTDGNGCISQDAHILAFETETAAREYLLHGYDAEDFDLDRAEIVAGGYSDCWVKLFDEPRADWQRGPFALSDVSVLRPGQHPGGRKWWIEPNAVVLTAIVPLKD